LAYQFNFVVVAAVGFVLNPFLLSALGPVMFGIWKSLQRYLDFATLADGRASQALKWIVANRVGLTDADKRRDVGAAIMVWLRFLPLAVLAGVVVTIMALQLIKGIPGDARWAVYATAAILALNTMLAGLISTPDSVLTGVNQGYKSMLVNTGAFIVSNILLILAARNGLPFWSLAVIVLISAIANSAVTLIIAKRSVPWWGVERPTSTDLRRVQSFSGWTIGGTAVDKLFMSTEIIIISVTLGTIAVTQYTFTSYVMTFVVTITQVAASAFMPAIGSHFGASETSKAVDVAKSIRHLAIGIAALGGSAALAFNEAFVTIWVGSQQYLGTTVNALLVLCSLQFAIIRLDTQVLAVTLRVIPTVVFGLAASAGGVIAGIATFFATHSLAGALLAVLAARLAANIAFPFLVSRQLPGSGMPGRLAFLAVAFLAACWAIGPIVASSDWTARGMIFVGWLVTAAAIAWFGLIPRKSIRELMFPTG